MLLKSKQTKKKPTIFKSLYTIVCCKCRVQNLNKSQFQCWGGIKWWPRDGGAGSSAGANWCSIILVNGTAFIYIPEDLVLVCMLQSFVFPPCEQIQNQQLENVGGLFYCVWHDICYIFYAFICTENEFFVSQSQQHEKMTNNIVVCCDTALDSDSILGLFWMGFPMNTFSWKYVFFYMMKQEAFWFLVLNYWHWSFFNCSNIQEVNFFTFILDFKL